MASVPPQGSQSPPSAPAPAPPHFPPPPVHWLPHPELLGSLALGPRDHRILVFMGVPTSPAPEWLHLCLTVWCRRFGPLGAGPFPAPLTCDRREAKQQQSQEEGGGQRAEARDRHGAAPGRGAGAAAAGWGDLTARSGGVGQGRGERGVRWGPKSPMGTAGALPPHAISQSPGIRCHSWPRWEPGT